MCAQFKPGKLLERTLKESNRNRKAVIGALLGYINADPYFKTNDFEDALDYVLSHGYTKNELFESFNNNDYPIIKNQTKWDKEYYALAMVDLKDNFSVERIEHVKKVGKFLGKPTSAVEAASRTKTTRGEVNKKKVQRGSSYDLIVKAIMILIVLLVIYIIFK